MSGRRVVELGEVREPALGELPPRDAGERGDELPVRDGRRAGANDGLRGSDGERSLQSPLVVANRVSDPDEVDVVVDQAGDHRAALEVDDLGIPYVADAAYRGELALFDQQRIDDGVARVERVNAPVD